MKHRPYNKESAPSGQQWKQRSIWWSLAQKILTLQVPVRVLDHVPVRIRVYVPVLLMA